VFLFISKLQLLDEKKTKQPKRNVENWTIAIGFMAEQKAKESFHAH
jgi:hypothetical protein